MLLGGDLNFCLDPILDQSASATAKTKAAKTTLEFMRDLNATDILRQIHPQTRDYSILLQPSQLSY